MKNIININVNNLGYYTLYNVDDGTNSINVQFNKSGICELYYGDQYYEQITIPDSGLVEIPEIYYSDGSNMRFRYKSGDVVSGFFHIIGDASQYSDVTLKKVTDAVIQISGVSNTDEEINSNLLPATRTRLGGVKAGAGLNVTKDGTLSVEPIEIEEIKQYVNNMDNQYSVYDKEPDPVTMYYWNTDEFAEEHLKKGGTVKDLLEIYNLALYNTANNDRNNKFYIDTLLDGLNKTRIGVINKNEIICTFAESGLENKFEVKGGGYILLDLGCEFYGNMQINYVESGSYTSKVFDENLRFDGERFKDVLFLEDGIKNNAVYSINLIQDPDRGCDPLDEIKAYVDVDQRDIQKSINLMYSKVKATDLMVEENVDFLMEEDNKVNARVDETNSNLTDLNKLTGDKSILFNQFIPLFSSSNWVAEENASVSFENNVATVTNTIKNFGIKTISKAEQIKQNIYYFSFELKTTSKLEVAFGWGEGEAAKIYADEDTGGVFKRFYALKKSNINSNSTVYIWAPRGIGTFSVKNAKVVNLTKMFGAGKEPTVKEFENLFPNDYYEKTKGIPISNIGIASSIERVNESLSGLSFSVSGTTLSITDGTNTWTLEAN